MKKTLILILIALILLVSSCDSGLTRMKGEESSVNYHIYPYLSFLPDEDTMTAAVYVKKGAALQSINIPGKTVVNGKSYDVVSLDYDSPEDAASLKRIRLEKPDIIIRAEILLSAKEFESIEQTEYEEDGKWHLPSLPHDEATHSFWKAGDKRIQNGDVIESDSMIAELVYGAHDNNTFAHDNTYHWKQCSVCGEGKSEKELHHFSAVNGMLVCQCGYIKTQSDGSGGFDVDIEIQMPKGKLIVEMTAENEWSITLTDENESHPITDFKWIVDGIEQEESNTALTISTEEKRSYSVLCIFSNAENLIGSASVSVSGS